MKSHIFDSFDNLQFNNTIRTSSFYSMCHWKPIQSARQIQSMGKTKSTINNYWTILVDNEKNPAFLSYFFDLYKDQRLDLSNVSQILIDIVNNDVKINLKLDFISDHLSQTMNGNIVKNSIIWNLDELNSMIRSNISSICFSTNTQELIVNKKISFSNLRSNFVAIIDDIVEKNDELMKTSNTTIILSTKINAPYNKIISSSHRSQPYVFILDDGQLPHGLSLLNNGLIHGVPVKVGTFEFKIKITNELNERNYQSYQLIIEPELIPQILPNPIFGQSYCQIITTAGGKPPYIFYVDIEMLPPGLSLSKNGQLQGIPSADGCYDFSVVVIDQEYNIGSQKYHLDITLPILQINNQPPSTSLLYILPYRGTNVYRKKNLDIVIEWLLLVKQKLKELNKSLIFDIIIVEEDENTTLKNYEQVEKIFIYNNQSFNKGWAFNVAFKKYREYNYYICGDADHIIPDIQLFCDQIIENCIKSLKLAYRPFQNRMDMTVIDMQSIQNITDLINKYNQNSLILKQHNGLSFAAGIIIISKETFEKLGGWNEKFRNWGRYDDYLTILLKSVCQCKVILSPTSALHLWHPITKNFCLNQYTIDLYNQLSILSIEKHIDLIELEKTERGDPDKYLKESKLPRKLLNQISLIK